MDPHENTQAATIAETSTGPVSGTRYRSPLREVIDSLQELSLAELADVYRYARRVRASRGDRPSPELVSNVVSVVLRLHAAYPPRVPLPLVYANFPRVPRGLIEGALFDAERRHLLRMETVELPAPFVEVGGGIPHARGLLYWIVPNNF